MNLKANAGRILYEARERQGLSRKDAERKTAKQGFRVSEATIFNIETGVSKNPWPRNIFALADAYGLDADDLFETEEASA